MKEVKDRTINEGLFGSDDALGSGENAQGGANPSLSTRHEAVDFDLTRESLKDLFLKKMDTKRVRNLQSLVSSAGLPWLWSGGREVELDISPAEYLIRVMEAYYEKVSNERVVLANETDKEIIDFPVKCRGSSRYSADVINKKENLEKYLKNDYDKSGIVFMTFTLSSNRVNDIWEAFGVFREAMNHISSQLQNEKHFGYRPNYLWVLEPHKSGYPHLHLVVFETRIPNIEDLASWWSDNYTEGRADLCGVDWERIPTRQAYNRVCSYISKYVIKTLSFENMETDQQELNLRLFWLGLLWLSGRRSWSYSRKIGNVMLYGLVMGWTNSTRFLLRAFQFEAKIYSFVGGFSQIEIDRLKESGNFNYEYFFNCQSSVSTNQSDVWDISKTELLGGD